MPKGYNIDKAREKQKSRSLRFDEGNPTEEVLNGFTSKMASKEAFYISLDELYSSPSKWNFFKKLDDSKLVEMMESIKEKGILNPILVWKKRRDELEEINNETDTYGFVGESYCILAGHSRSFSMKILYEQTGDERYSKIPCFIYEDIDKATAEYLTIVSNYVQRNLTKEDRRKSIAYMYRTLSKTKDKTISISDTISQQTNMSPRAVWNEIKITNDLIDYFSSEYDKGNLTQSNVLKIARLSKKMQVYIVENYKDKINNNTLKKFKPSYDKKSQIDALFSDDEEAIEYINITMPVPSELKEEFKNMAKRWIQRQIKTDET